MILYTEDAFHIKYLDKKTKVTPCQENDGNQLHYVVHLEGIDIVLQLTADKESDFHEYWIEIGKGNTPRATQLGSLIEAHLSF